MKKRLLVVASNGMMLRQFCLNDQIFKGLSTDYEVCICTRIMINGLDQLDSTSVVTINPESSKSWIRILARKLGLKFIHLFHYSDSLWFQYDAGLSEQLGHRIVAGNTKIDIGFGLTLFRRASASKDGIIQILARIVCWIGSAVRSYTPDKVLILQIADYECQFQALAANYAGIPVVCYSLGMDNYRNQRQICEISKYLVWGGEQKRDLTERNVLLNRRRVEPRQIEVVGNVIFDEYEKIKARLLGSQSDAERRPTIFLGVMSEETTPGQENLIIRLLRFIKDNNLPHLLCVRIVPGLDHAFWHAIERTHSEAMFIYEPQDSSFDKRGMQSVFDINQARAELEALCRQIVFSDVVLLTYPSTLALDAAFLETPVITALFSYSAGKNTIESCHVYSKFFKGRLVQNPHWNGFNECQNYEDLFEKLFDIVVNNQGEKYIPKALLENVVRIEEGISAGQRLVDAI